ncbi:GNAT family N-acetyltransferase [Prosthecodimorpha staleyi]|uniref:GNAT family N-acetyltransferase n=1 Tax=Prosthecodimorpha staleyi TaxID=2840188 RepID=A0A947GFE0_9HYPH|nr:GNAT family N-acetyltransferase [Prosthecodimorpha staleyi]MBT9290465.1 GNAT family N-acetyltransferase [Prosthecodimorpha staleyi]
MTAPAAPLSLRTGFAADPAARAAVAALLNIVFDIDIAPLERLGGWEEGSVPFAWFEGETCVANVTAHPKPMMLQGKAATPWSIVSVATRPDRRGRGLFRDLMARALAHCDRETDLVILATATPDLYRPFGFRPIAEHAFAGSPPAPIPASGLGARRLDLADDADAARLVALFGDRAPVSDLCGLLADRPFFMLKALEEPQIALAWLEALRVVAAIETDGKGLRLLDIVGPAIPSLAAILAELGTALGGQGLDGPPSRIEVYFPPDRLAWRPAEIIPEDSGWMVRGPWPLDGVPAMLSPMTL